MRLDRFICKSTELTRTEALTAIQAGLVSVAEEPVRDERCQVHTHTSVTLAGERLTPRPFRYIMLHKPAGTICSNVDEGYPSLFNLLAVEHPDELHIVGRLDVDTTGLVLITDDGSWSFGITNPGQLCGKRYRVGLRDPLAPGLIERFAQGLPLQGEAEPTKPATLVIESPQEALLTITEGKFHQVKRMFAAVGNRVQRLHREQIGELTLDVEPGEWRYLTEAEVALFQYRPDSD